MTESSLIQAALYGAQMTSKEVSELVEKRHDNVKRTIETLANQGVIAQPRIEDVPFVDESGRSRQVSAYVFSGEQGKRDSIIVVAQLSPEFTARLVDRWQELEQRQATTPQSLALSIIETELRIAALFKAPEHLAQSEAVKAARLETGLDYSKYLLSAPAQDRIAEEYLEPADLAARFNIADGATVNRWLATCGLQTKSYGGWAPTEEGKAYCIRHHWTKGPKSGYNWKWSVRYLEELLRQANWPL